MRLSVAGREQQKNTNYAFRALRAVQLLSQVCGITATQLYEAIAVAWCGWWWGRTTCTKRVCCLQKLVCCVWQTYDKYEACMRLYEGYDKYGWRIWRIWPVRRLVTYDGEKQVWRVQMVVWLVRSSHKQIGQVRRMLKGVVCVGRVQMTLGCARWMYECVRWVRSRTRWWTVSSTMLSHRQAVMTGTKCVWRVQSRTRWWTVSSMMLSHRWAVMTGTKCVRLVWSGARWWTVSS